jgi:membrane peptidoglycan carboxypeptidase
MNLSDVEFFKNYINNLKWNGIWDSDKMVLCWVKQEDFFRGDYDVDNDGCLVLRYQDLLSFLNDIKLLNGDRHIEYWTGRKDIVLGRMLEEGYINFNEYKEGVINWIGYAFQKSTENIKAPHFVFFVKEYLEEKYGQEIISVGWFKIYTTLDPKLQAKAQELVEKQVASNTTRFNATNAALISLDNKNWDILAMVWGVDYFDQENKWNVNIVTSPLQPGSSFKPFVYSIWIYNQQIGSKTPIYDLETTFPWNYTPKNFEWGFLGKMNISTALGHSRNIPALKMFYMAWWEANIVSFMKKLWVQSLKDHWQYGAPLALWTWEMTPLEMATAYSVFANLWEKVEINPILKIVDSKWNIIEEKREPKKEQVVSEAQTYIINSILSDTSTRPSSRNNYISLGGTRPVAAKTWTSTKQFEKNGRKDIYPANLWTIWYTPQITTVVWAWNVDGSQVWMSWDWLNWAWPIWRDFMSYAHEWKPVETWKRPSSVYEINISEISWLLPNPENSGANLFEKSLFVNKPTEYDQSYQTIQIDALCGWKVTENTPSAAIRTATLIEFHSLNPDNSAWETPVQEWANSEEAREKYWNISSMVTSVSNEICQRETRTWNVTIGSNIKDNGNYNVWENYLEIWYKSTNPIKSIEILVNDNVIQNIDAKWKKEWIYYWSLFIAWMHKNQNLKIEIRAVDEEYYSTSEVKNIFIWSIDSVAPVISMINPIDSNIKLYDVDYFNLKVNVEDTSKVEVIIYVDW